MSQHVSAAGGSAMLLIGDVFLMNYHARHYIMDIEKCEYAKIQNHAQCEFNVELYDIV